MPPINLRCISPERWRILEEMTMETVAAHEIIDHLVEIYDVAAHPQRKGESPEFTAAVKRLQEDGHHKCFICGTEEDIECHHFLCEWSLASEADFAKLFRLAQIFDVYGYGRLLQNKPIDTVDDIRNLMNLCKAHHIERATGIHSTTFSAWVSQCLAKDGINIVPQDRAEIERLIRAKQECMRSMAMMSGDSSRSPTISGILNRS